MIEQILKDERPADIAPARGKSQEQSTRDKAALLKKAADLDKTLATLGYTVEIYKASKTGHAESGVRGSKDPFNVDPEDFMDKYQVRPNIEGPKRNRD